MSSEEQTIKPDTAIKAISNAPMLVALFLILLTFFIVLNSISIVDHTKSQNLLQSVSKKFSNKTQIIIKDKDKVTSDKITNLFFKEIETWAMSVYTVDGMVPVKSGNSVMIRIPTSIIFEDERAEFTPQAEPKIKALADVLANWMQNYRVVAEAVINVPVEDSLEDKRTELLSIERSALLAEKLVDLRVKDSSIYPGIRKTRGEYAGYIIFRFAMLASAVPQTKPGSAELKEEKSKEK